MLKVSLLCESLLLKMALENFLKERVSLYPESDLAITDKLIQISKPTLYIGHGDGANLRLPFSKAKLSFELEKLEKKIVPTKSRESYEEPEFSKNDETLDAEIEKITHEYALKLLDAFKEKLHKTGS